MENFLPLVRALAGRLAGRGEPADLVQAGCEGLLLAAGRYDPRYGVPFQHYAARVIVGQMARALRDQGLQPAGRRPRELARRAEAARDRLRATHGREPTLPELASTVGVEAAELVEAWETTRPPLSLDAPARSGQPSPLGELLASPGPAAEETVVLRDALRRLTPRQRQILYWRYFRDATQVEVAGALGLSQSQVSRIERAALESLRRQLAP